MSDLNEDQLLKACLSGSQEAYRLFYFHFAPKMMAVCLRYSSNKSIACDLLQEGFIKVFEGLSGFRKEGSLEGWIRKIMVNTALENYRKTSKLFTLVNLEDIIEEPISAEDILSQLSTDEILELVQQLPPSYRLVFNLHVFEGMKHREIAEKLSISEGTSKSNLADARAILKQKIKQSQVVFQKRKA